jgi:Fic family protein
VPYPEYGGVVRTTNPYVKGAKFETTDNSEIFPELLRLDKEVAALDQSWKNMPHSEVILRVAKIHHRITRIHPFSDGNGRTSRAFANVMLMRYGMVPIYVGVEEKNRYFHALATADRERNYGDLWSFMVDKIVDSHVELAR